MAGSENWSGSRGAFLVGEALYTGWEDGRLLARRFEGDQAGEPRAVALQGLGEAGFPVGRLSGTFYHRGRLYYTVAGDPRLRYRCFSPESGVVGAEAFVVSGEGDGMDWSATQGVTLAGEHVYLTAGMVDGAPRWRNRGLFVG